MKNSSEAFKTLLIVLLVLFTVALLAGFFVMTLVSEPLSPADIIFELRNASGKSKTVSKEENRLSTAAYPSRIVFLKGGGDLFYPADLQGYESALESTFQLFQEAVGSASNYTPSTVDTYLVALLDYGIVYYFDYPVPIEMLCAWGDGDYVGESINVARMVLCAAEGTPRLIIVDHEGKVYLTDTQSDWAFAESMCKTYTQNGRVAAIIPDINAAADTPILSSLTQMSSYTVLPSLYETEGELSWEIMATLSVNPYLATVYRDGDAVVYMEGDRRLRLYSDGHISFSNISKDEAQPAKSLSEGELLAAVEEARRAAFSIWEQLSFRQSRLSLSQITEDETGITVYFEAYIGGAFVSRGDYAAAAVTVKDGNIAALSLYPLRIQEESTVEIMPFMLAQATLSSNARMSIYYKLQDGTLVPGIVNMKGGR